MSHHRCQALEKRIKRLSEAMLHRFDELLSKKPNHYAKAQIELYLEDLEREFKTENGLRV